MTSLILFAGVDGLKAVAWLDFLDSLTSRWRSTPQPSSLAGMTGRCLGLLSGRFLLTYWLALVE